MDARRERLKRILDEALGHSGDERDAYLASACGADGDLRREVDSLLAAHAAAGDFLGGERAPGEDLERPGDVIGHYRLIEPIGEGGFGLVWRARQDAPIRRVVALKTIKGGMDTRQVIARFEAERQALALMEHPNIARIHDAGTTKRGRPYFVMELVDGAPLNAYCDERRLPLRARLEIFLQICSALQHAHQKGVIHRDLKPANVLVEERAGSAIPKVIDFGIAKAVGATLSEHTVMGGLTSEWGALGTPAYMAPEQTGLKGLDVDTRTDVYSLGALLYELLTGARIFDLGAMRETTFEELLRLVREVDPVRPSERCAADARTGSQAARARGATPAVLRQALRGDLDWIVTKALEKDRERRYASVDALARDVERHLAHEPVTAGPPSRLYRLRKFLRRNRLQTTAGALVVVGMLAGLAGALSGLERARAGEAEAKRQFTIANATLDFLTKDLLAKVAPAEMGKDVPMRAVLDAASVGIEGRFQDEPLVEAAIRRTLGHTYGLLGELSVAEHHIVRALELQEHFDPDSEFTLMVARDLGAALDRQGRYPEARGVYERTLAAQQRLLGPEHEETLTTCNNLGLLLLHLDEIKRAEALHRETLAIRLRTLGEEHESTLVSMSNLAMVLQRQGRFAEAEEWIVRELEICRRKNGEEHPSTLISLNNLATLLCLLDRDAEAEPLLRKVIAAEERVRGPTHHITLTAQANLAGSFYNRGRYQDAVDVLEPLLKLTAGVEPRPPAVFTLAQNLGTALWALKRYEETEELALEWIEIASATYGPDGHTTAEFEKLLGIALGSQGHLEDAVNVLGEVFERLPADSLDGAEVQCHRGRFLVDLGRDAEAEPCFLSSLEIHRKIGLGSSDSFREVVVDLLGVYRRLGREEDAAVWRAELERP